MGIVSTNISFSGSSSGENSSASKITYTLTKTGSTIYLNGSDGSETSVEDSGIVYSLATSTTDGLMSSDDKANLDTHIADNDKHITAEERAAWDAKADLSDIPDKLPADGGNADTAERTVWENHVRDNTDILELADNAPELQRSFVRVNRSKNCPTDYGYSETNNDFWYVVDKLNALYATIIAVDVKSSAIFINTKSGGSWMGWKKIITDE